MQIDSQRMSARCIQSQQAALDYLSSMRFTSERKGQASGTGSGSIGSGTPFISQTAEADSGTPWCILRPCLGAGGAGRRDLQPERGAGQGGLRGGACPLPPSFHLPHCDT